MLLLGHSASHLAMAVNDGSHTRHWVGPPKLNQDMQECTAITERPLGAMKTQGWGHCNPKDCSIHCDSTNPSLPCLQKPTQAPLPTQTPSLKTNQNQPATQKHTAAPAATLLNKPPLQCWLGASRRPLRQLAPQTVCFAGSFMIQASVAAGCCMLHRCTWHVAPNTRQMQTSLTTLQRGLLDSVTPGTPTPAALPQPLYDKYSKAPAPLEQGHGTASPKPASYKPAAAGCSTATRQAPRKRIPATSTGTWWPHKATATWPAERSHAVQPRGGSVLRLAPARARWAADFITRGCKAAWHACSYAHQQASLHNRRCCCYCSSRWRVQLPEGRVLDACPMQPICMRDESRAPACSLRQLPE